MEKVPKIVSDRLKAGAVAVEHPDADVLTAFSEQSLPEHERRGVMEHLARCGDCREIVALALPEEAVTVAVRESSGSWLTWPMLRWGLVAAGIVAVASIGVMKYRQENARSESIALYKAPEAIEKKAENRPEPTPSTPEATKLADSAAPPPPAAKTLSAEKKAEADKEETRADLDRPQPKRSRDEKATFGYMTNQRNLAHGPSVRSQMQQNSFYANNSQAPQVQIPAAPPGFAKQAAPSLIANAPAAAPARASGAGANSSPANGLTTNEPQEAIVIADRSLPSQPPNSGHADMVERAKSPDFLMPVYKSPASEAAPTQAYNYSGTDLYGPNTRWTISAGGGLMRSVDQGHSWQDVSVVAGAIGAPVSAGASLESATKASHARVAQKDKADQSVHGSPTSAPLVFRAVAANGADVWAGGSTGQLYHSVDYGAHWARVVPFASGIVLTGDIVSLEFTDAQHGRVMTSMAQVWTTADGGTTWQKQ